LRKVVRSFWEQHLSRRRFLGPIPLISALAFMAILFAPIWPDREDAWFVIEATTPQVLHAGMAGRVDEVMVRQGDTVRAGQPLLRMSSAEGASMLASATAESSQARFQVVGGELRGEGAGTAEARENGAWNALSLAEKARTLLEVKAPADGIILTEDPKSLTGQFIASGGALLSFADAGARSVRVYIPAAALDHIPGDAEVSLMLPGSFSVMRMKLAPPGGEAFELPAGLASAAKYKGTQAPIFYCALMPLPASAGSAPLGTGGQAKILGRRHSLAERSIRAAADLVHDHAW